MRELIVMDAGPDSPDIAVSLSIETQTLAVRSALCGAGLENSGRAPSDGGLLHPDLAGTPALVSDPFVIDLAMMRRKNNWKDYCIWALMHEGPENRPAGLINLLAESCFSRRHSDQRGLLLPLPAYLHLYVPYADAGFDAIGLRVMLPSSGSRLYSNQPFERCSPEVLQHHFTSWFQTLHINGPDEVPAQEKAIFSLAAFRNGEPCNMPLEIFLETTSGYLPRTRIQLAGEAGFAFRALDLEPGDIATLRAGFRFYPALTQKTVRIV